VFGCDINDQHAGKFIFDKCSVVPECRSVGYMDALRKIIKEFRIDIVLPASEPELRFFTQEKLYGKLFDKPLVTANLNTMKIGFDKLLTTEFLKNEGLPFPVTQIASDEKEPNLPVIMKSRNGSGSKSLFLIKEMNDYNFYRKKYPDFIVQELIENDDAEFTCGVFRDSKGNVRIISYKRKLMGGFSGFGIVIQNNEIDELLLNIAEKIDLRGSINVQLRLSNRGPLVFEINPRFSSTVMFRHLMGFKDVIWSIQDQMGDSISDYTEPKIGTKFYKGFCEYID